MNSRDADLIYRTQQSQLTWYELWAAAKSCGKELRQGAGWTSYGESIGTFICDPKNTYARFTPGGEVDLLVMLQRVRDHSMGSGVSVIIELPLIHLEFHPCPHAPSAQHMAGEYRKTKARLRGRGLVHSRLRMTFGTYSPTGYKMPPGEADESHRTRAIDLTKSGT